MERGPAETAREQAGDLEEVRDGAAVRVWGPVVFVFAPPAAKELRIGWELPVSRLGVPSAGAP
ncbi:MAG: hypothetical protein GY866_25765 [Proteobacteria bacterium]|nr:hypothetical protein [Pseudomonadota bacterium]